MSLTGALSIAASGLDGVQYALSVASQNVANANTAGYVRETASLVSVEGNGVGSGVRPGATLRATDPGLQQQAWTQTAVVSRLQVTSDALGTISTLLGSTASSGSAGGAVSATLPDLLGSLQSAFVALSSDPSSSAAQQGVLGAADTLASRVNALAGAYQAQRQTAQDRIVSDVGSAADDLSTIGSLSDRIVLLKAQGSDTADLENQRDSAMSDLAQYVSVQFKQTSAGDMLVRTASGLALPTRGTATLSTQGASIDASSVAPATIPPITLGGRDVTALLTGGTIGAAVTLRDATLPTMQAQLDSLAGATANRFSAAGLDLFSTQDGALPGASGSASAPTGQLGFSTQMVVNPAVVSNPGLVVQGTAASVGNMVASNDQDLITAVLKTTFGSGSASALTAGLGASGALDTGYSGSGSLTALAANLTASQASAVNQAGSRLATEQTVQTKLSTALSTATGVTVDDEMAHVVALQNSYAANAKVISAVQSMFSALLDAVGR